MPLRSPANKSNPDLGNVEVINALRGVVALAVMWFHFTRPCDLPRDHFHQTIPCANTWLSHAHAHMDGHYLLFAVSRSYDHRR